MDRKQKEENRILWIGDKKGYIRYGYEIWIEGSWLYRGRGLKGVKRGGTTHRDTVRHGVKRAI